MARERNQAPPTRGKAKPADTAQNGHEPAPEGVPANGILVIRTCDENGNIGVQVQRLGDVKVTELLTVLELAQRNVRESMNLG